MNNIKGFKLFNMSIIKCRYNWHAVYTKSRAEKKLHSTLSERNIECYLPLKKELRQWGQRKYWIEEPLLRSYLFVRVSEREYYNVLNAAGAVCYVTFGEKAAIIPENQIEALKTFMKTGNRYVELTHNNLKKGDLVEVACGPLKGVLGEVVEMRGQQRILLRFESLGLCVHTDISLNELRKVSALEMA